MYVVKQKGKEFQVGYYVVYDFYQHSSYDTKKLANEVMVYLNGGGPQDIRVTVFDQTGKRPDW